ncbi:serine/threonine-protein phosphatase 2A 56 kDa regulatory subunit gamma isoform-like isoform X2 [Vespula squamosa]|uniref:Serine/threonine-protein phosphatase 2A 56 kDa regulatory subunit gamma isoform-like isoform X2 n=1 Tax=Vespula squamosa TaxID=30214 RepID=A0ABD2BRS2_VESSQ
MPNLLRKEKETSSKTSKDKGKNGNKDVEAGDEVSRVKTKRNVFGLNDITSLKNIFYAYEIFCRCVISLGMEPRRNMKRATVFVYHFAFLWEQHDGLLVRFQASEL